MNQLIWVIRVDGKEIVTTKKDALREGKRYVIAGAESVELFCDSVCVLVLTNSSASLVEHARELARVTDGMELTPQQKGYVALWQAVVA